MANYPLAFGELLAGSILLDKGIQAFKSGLSSTPTTGGAAAAPPTDLGSGKSTQTGVSYMRALTTAGLSPIAAAGVVGNLYQESSLNPSSPGGGLAQWLPGWFSQMAAWAESHGLNPSSAAGQLAYIAHDLAASYPSLLDAMNAAQDPADAALMFSQNYEKPSIPDNANREAFATAVYAAAGY